jgi:hypothetical protein
MKSLSKVAVMLGVTLLPVAAHALPPVGLDLETRKQFERPIDPERIDLGRLTKQIDATPDVSRELAKYFTEGEIAQYKRALDEANLSEAHALDGEVNRLTDPNHNRCGDDQIPYGDCPPYQTFAWNDGNGCINATEYNYAMGNAIAPLCAPFDRTTYVGWCRCGCFEKTTTLRAIALSSGAEEQAVVSTIGADTHEVFAMTEDSTWGAFSLEPRTLTATTVGDEELPLVWVRLANGVSLGLTTQHAVLLSSGVMVTAEALSTSDVLVAEDGQPVAITGIDRSPTTDPVYNVLTDAGLSHKGHLIVANGIVVGDIMWQNTLAADLGDVVVRY